MLLETSVTTCLVESSHTMTVDTDGWGAVALAEFSAEFEVELSFKEGDLLTVLNVAAPEGWLKARDRSGKEGLVPESYLAPEGGDDDGFGDDAGGDDDGFAGLGGFVEVGRGRLLADFTAEADGEMSVEAGGVITLMQPAEGLPEGWLYGRRGDVEGLVPESYVERLMPGSDEPIPADLLAEVGAMSAEEEEMAAAYDDMGGLDDSYGAALAARRAGGSVGVPGGGDGLVMMLADFSAEDAKEVSASRGETLFCLENQGDGWAVVAREAGGEPAGLVPFEFLSPPHGKMLAAFSPEDEGEVTAEAGQRLWQLEPTPDGAPAAADFFSVLRPAARPPRPPPPPLLFSPSELTLASLVRARQAPTAGRW